MPLNKSINKTVEEFKTMLRANESFDLIYRTININSRTTCFFFIDGLIKDAVMEKMLEFFRQKELANSSFFANIRQNPARGYPKRHFRRPKPVSARVLHSKSVALLAKGRAICYNRANEIKIHQSGRLTAADREET